MQKERGKIRVEIKEMENRKAIQIDLGRYLHMHSRKHGQECKHSYMQAFWGTVIPRKSLNVH